MSNLYGGLTTPHWNQIDKIHYGPASTLEPETDGIMLGRYVLVKYTKDVVFSQADRLEIISGTYSPVNDTTNDWLKYYNNDSQIDYDGVVFIKTTEEIVKDNDKKETIIVYKPVARLDTTVSENDFQKIYNKIGIPDKINEETDIITVVTVKDYIDGIDQQLRSDLVGAMHFKGVVDKDPTKFSDDEKKQYKAGDVVIWKDGESDKEYVFQEVDQDGNTTKIFVELGDVTAEQQAISTLQGEDKDSSAREIAQDEDNKRIGTLEINNTKYNTVKEYVDAKTAFSIQQALTWKKITSTK